MASYERDVRSPQYNRSDGRFNPNLHDNSSDIPIGDLLRRFGQDAAALVRQEITLAKLELRETATGYARDAGKLGAAAVVGWFGAMALVAFCIIGLGALINNYWLSALIVAVVFLGIAGLMAKSALEHMKRNRIAPEETVQTLKEDQTWAKQEAQDFKRRLKA